MSREKWRKNSKTQQIYCLVDLTEQKNHLRNIRIEYS